MGYNGGMIIIVVNGVARKTFGVSISEGFALIWVYRVTMHFYEFRTGSDSFGSFNPEIPINTTVILVTSLQ